MVVMTDCESLNIKDNMIFRFFLHLKKKTFGIFMFMAARKTLEGG